MEKGTRNRLRGKGGEDLRESLHEDLSENLKTHDSHLCICIEVCPINFMHGFDNDHIVVSQSSRESNHGSQRESSRRLFPDCGLP
jgi:hypothetical protein